MLGLKQMWDNIFAPPGALSSPEIADAMTINDVQFTHETTTHLASDMPVEFHNDFGTAADYSVPASSSFDSFDSFSSGFD
jgi:hypothetical protein